MIRPINVLYQDEFLAVFDKPAGLLVIPSPGKNEQTLAQLVNEQFPDPLKGRWHACHRLDRETSGAIIFARGKKNQQAVMDLFRRRQVRKKYTAFVRGKMTPAKGVIKSVIRDYHQERFHKSAPGRLAVTHYEVKAVKHGYSVVEVIPETGRTNQIRIHFREKGHPLLGERIYAFGKDFPVKFRRLALHAGEVTFRHPVFNRKVTVTAELPDDMKNFLHNH